MAGGDEVVSLDMSRKMDYLHCSLTDPARGTVADGSDAKSVRTYTVECSEEDVIEMRA